jgi:hypothetical protein
MESENVKLFVLWRESILDGVEPAEIEGGWASLFEKLGNESPRWRSEIKGTLYFIVRYLTNKLGAETVNATWFAELKSSILSQYRRLIERVQNDTLPFQAKERMQVCMYRSAMSELATHGMGKEKGSLYAEFEARALESDKVFEALVRA